MSTKPNPIDADKQKIKRGNYMVAGWVCVIVGVFFFFMMAKTAYERWQLIQGETRLIEAKTKKFSSYTSLSGVHYSVDYEFNLSGDSGATYKGGAMLPKSALDRITKEGKILVRYLKDNPSVNLAEKLYQKNGKTTWQWIVLGGVILIVAVIAGRWFFQKAKAPEPIAETSQDTTI